MKRYKYKLVSVLVSILMLVVISSCASLQDSWKKLTPDEKARVITNDLQDQLNNAWDTVEAYVQQNPQHQLIFKEKIAPAFKAANSTLRSAMILAMEEKITPDKVYAAVMPVFKDIVDACVAIGLKLSLPI